MLQRCSQSQNEKTWKTFTWSGRTGERLSCGHQTLARPAWLFSPSLGSSTRKTDWLVRERLNWALRVSSGLDRRTLEATRRHWTLTSHDTYRLHCVSKVREDKAWKDVCMEEKTQDRDRKRGEDKIKASLSPVCSSFVRRRCGCFTYKNYLGTPQITYTRTHRMYYNQPLQRQGK